MYTSNAANRRLRTDGARSRNSDKATIWGGCCRALHKEDIAATKRSTVTAPPKLTVVKLMPFPEKGGGPALNAEPLSWHPRAEAKHVRNILGLDGRVMPGARAVAMSVPVGGSGGAGTFADTLSFISNGLDQDRSWYWTQYMANIGGGWALVFAFGEGLLAWMKTPQG